MRQILKDSDNELVVVVRSPLIVWIGAFGMFFLCHLLYLLISRDFSNMERIQGLTGASAVCMIAVLFAYEKCDFRFDLRSRLLTWSRQRSFARRSGTVPFDAIQGVTLQSCIGNSRYSPKHRVVLDTREGELPVMIAYEHDAMNETIAERIRAVLGTSSNTLVKDSVTSLVERGREMDAIRLLREKDDISLTEAHTVIARLKAGKGPDSGRVQGS